MNRPYFASRNQAIFSSCEAGAGKIAGNGTSSGAFAGTEPAQQGIPQDICRVAQPSNKANASAVENKRTTGKIDFFFMMTSVVGAQRRNFHPHGYTFRVERLY